VIAEPLDPRLGFGWLADIEVDLAIVQQTSKANRLVPCNTL
jgi:hypothetical protein